MRINTTIASLAVVVSMGCTCTPQAKHEPAEQRIAVTGVSLTRSEMQLAPGDNFKLVARVSPANATDPSVRWSSDQPEIVAIDAESGEARALAQGDASVTVTTTDGSFTASCSVKVSGASVKPVDPEKPVGPENPENPGTPSDPGAPSAYGVIPTEGQVAWQRQELLMFYHYGQATFSGWDGENPNCNGKPWSESLLLANYKPVTIDADQWVKVAADNGFKEVILTAKHHDGFCLWDNPESTTDVANAGCSNHTDVVQAVRNACNKYGVKLGIYLSPWDRMIEAKRLSTSAYEAQYKKAITDLMTKYAPVVEFWFDGNHAGDFNWASVNQVVFDANPQCVIFSNGGPGCRWVGNENGDAGTTNWNTINIKGRGLSPSNLPGNYESYLSQGDENGDTWCPAECDFSIQQIGDHNGWFYGAGDSRKTAKQLMKLYYESVGRGGVFLMNVPPSDAGVIDTKEKKIIEEFTAMRSAVFGSNLAAGATATSASVRGGYSGYAASNILDGNYDTYFATDNNVTTAEIEIALDGAKTFNRVMLQEYIPLGQRVKSFTVQVKKNGSWSTWGRGTTIGHKRILLGSSVTADAVKIRIESALACPVINGFGLYNDTVSGL